MEPNRFIWPPSNPRNQVQPRVLALAITLILNFPALSHGHETTGFKPSTNNINNPEKSNGNSADSVVSKAVDFITGNPNQRSLSNNSQSQSYADYYTRGLGQYPGGGGGTSVSTGQLGYYPQNYGQFGGIGLGQGGIGVHQGSQFALGGGVNKGLPYPGGPYTYPLGQFPGFSPHHEGGIGKPPFQQIPQQQYPFHLNPPLGLPAVGGFFQQGFPHGQGHHYPGGGGGGGIGGGSHLYFGIPKQIRVPGRIEISLSGNDAEIICEFPRFLILIQKVYWHHKYDDPYGTYYDTSNRFGPRITVITPDKWRSILQIRDYNEDDFGTYRCLSAAILPDESSTSGYDDHRGQILRSPSTTTEVSASSSPQHGHSTRLQIPEPAKTRNSKDMKFPSAVGNRVARKIRFSRSTVPKPLLRTSASDFHQIETLNGLGNGLNKELPTRLREFDLTKSGSEGVYDPYYYQGHQDQEGPTSRNYFLDQNHHLPHPGRGPYSTSTIPSIGGVHPPNHHHQYQDPRYGAYPNYGQQQPGNPNHNYVGPYAPYYKPSYGIFMIYQEIKFAHPQSRGGPRNTSIRSNSVKL